MTQIYVRPLVTSDTNSLVSFHNRNKSFFEKTSPLKPETFYTYEEQLKIIANSIILAQKDKEYSFGIFLSGSNELIGNISLTGVTRDILQSANIRYSLDKQHIEKGYATEAISMVIQYAFKELHLHRVQAAVMPENIASIRALEKNNFSHIGLVKGYLEINGQWRDHILYVITTD